MAHHKSTQDIVKRMKRAAGHLHRVISMLEDDKPCLDVIQQFQAVISALHTAKQTYIHEHIEGCLETASNADPGELNRKIKEFKEVAKYL